MRCREVSLTAESQSNIILGVSLSASLLMFLVQPTACLPSAVPVQCIMQKYLKWEAVGVTVTVRLKYLEIRTS